MAIMKLSNVPELNEFAGTEKIYVNDNGETKQIACDKVVTAGGGGGGTTRTIITDNDSPSAEEWVNMIENGDDIWVTDNGCPCRVIAWDWSVSCGSGRYLRYTYGAGTVLRQGFCAMIFDSNLINRLTAITQ